MCNLKNKEPKYIRHYTNVKALFGILKKGFRFAEPRANWDDLNDYFTLIEYGKLTDKDVYTLCFCEGLGNAHHWFYYGYNTNALTYENCYENIKCNIKLDTKRFEQLLKQQDKTLELREVKYVITNEEASLKKYPDHKTLSEVLYSKEDLPILKRCEYETEKEWRVVLLKDKKAADEPKEDIYTSNIMGCIEKISLLLDEESITYRLLEKKITCMYPELKGKIDNSGVHKSKRWEQEINRLIKERNIK